MIYIGIKTLNFKKDFMKKFKLLLIYFLFFCLLVFLQFLLIKLFNLQAIENTIKMLFIVSGAWIIGLIEQKKSKKVQKVIKQTPYEVTTKELLFIVIFVLLIISIISAFTEYYYKLSKIKMVLIMGSSVIFMGLTHDLIKFIKKIKIRNSK